MDSRTSYFFKNTSIFAIGTLGAKLINFFLVPFYTYVLTQEEYGTVDLIFTISMFIVPLIMFNLGEAIMRYSMDRNISMEKIFTIALCAVAFGFFILIPIIPIFNRIDLLSSYTIYIIIYIFSSALKEIVNGFLRGKEMLKLYVSCNLLETFLIACFNIYFLVVLKKGIEGYLLAYILSAVISIMLAFIGGRLYRYLNYLKFDYGLAKKMIIFSLAVIPNSLLWWAINSSDRIMVSTMSGIAENGLLAVSYKLPSIMTMFSGVLMQAWKYSAIRDKDSADRDLYANQMYSKYCVGISLVSGALLLIIKPCTSILFEASYYNSWQSSLFLLVGFVFMGCSTFIGTIYYVEKNMVGNMLSALVGAIVNIILNCILIPHFGASGATLAACISYFVIFIYRYIDTRKYQKIEVFKLQYILTLLFVILIAVGNLFEGTVGIAIMLFSFTCLIFINRKSIIDIIASMIH